MPAVFVGLVGAMALLSGCGRSAEGLAPAQVALLPGSVGAQSDDLIVIANDRFPLRWKGEWVPIEPPESYDRFLTGPAAVMCWSEQENKFACVPVRDTGERDVFIYFLDRALYQGWDGRYAHAPLPASPLAVRLEGSTAHLIVGLYQSGNPGRMLRVAYDRITLNENVKPGTTAGTAKMAALALPGDWPLRSEVVQAAFLGGEGLTAALAGAGEVVRWDPEQPERLEPCLTVAQVAAQGVSADQVKAARLTLLTGPRGTPAYAAYFLSGKVLVWRLPVEGAPEFVGDAQTVGSGEVLRLAARPDGQGWAVLIGGAAPAAASGTTGVPPVAGTLYLTGPKFASPQALDLPGRSVADPAWSPTGDRLYFVVDGTEIWRSDSGQAPQQVAVAPAQMSLEMKPGK